MNFVYSHLEDYIYNLYTSIGITNPKQLDPKIIAPLLGINLIYLPCDSTNTGNVIFLDSRLPKEEQWQEFGHELCHSTLHSGNQTKSIPLFREYQEWKANSFALHFCIPTFMLNKITLPLDKEMAIIKIQLLFNVDYDFASRRLDHYLINHLPGNMNLSEAL